MDKDTLERLRARASQHFLDSIAVKQEAENLAHPTRDDFAKDQDGEDAYDRAMYMFEAKKNAKIIKETKEVLIVESIGDALSLYSAGIKNVIVSFGLDISTSIINFLLKLDVTTIRICFNNDSENKFAGNNAAEKGYEKLTKFFDRNQIVINLPSKKDFGEMSAEEITQWVD